MSETARVFMIEKPRAERDMSAAAEYGEIVTLIDPGQRRPPVFHVDDYARAMLRFAREKNFNPDVDHFCLSGSLIGVALTLSSLTSAYESVSVLLFDASSERYVRRVIRTSQWVA